MWLRGFLLVIIFCLFSQAWTAGFLSLVQDMKRNATDNDGYNLVNATAEKGAGSTNKSNSATNYSKNHKRHNHGDHKDHTVFLSETLCARSHNNTAFIGQEPTSRLVVASAYDCQQHCMEQYPKCVAVVFYYIFAHGESNRHLCFLFAKNSIDDGVSLVPEKPVSEQDVIRALEIVPDCHEFDPFPPLLDPVAISSDKVSREKRANAFSRRISVSSAWTKWSSCSRIKRQIRTQTCEYGHRIQRRSCKLRHPPSGQIPLAAQTTATAQYPPQPYSHPQPDSAEYIRRMQEHQQQVEQSCCYRLQRLIAQINADNAYLASIGQQPILGIGSGIGGQLGLPGGVASGYYQGVPGVGPGGAPGGDYDGGISAGIGAVDGGQPGERIAAGQPGGPGVAGLGGVAGAQQIHPAHPRPTPCPAVCPSLDYGMIGPLTTMIPRVAAGWGSQVTTGGGVWGPTLPTYGLGVQHMTGLQTGGQVYTQQQPFGVGAAGGVPGVGAQPSGFGVPSYGPSGQLGVAGPLPYGAGIQPGAAGPVPYGAGVQPGAIGGLPYGAGVQPGIVGGISYGVGVQPGVAAYGAGLQPSVGLPVGIATQPIPQPPIPIPTQPLDIGWTPGPPRGIGRLETGQPPLEEGRQPYEAGRVEGEGIIPPYVAVQRPFEGVVQPLDTGKPSFERVRPPLDGIKPLVTGDQEERYVPEWGPWTEWTPCSATCGSGTQTRLRSRPGQPDDFEERRCELRPCVTDTWSQWCEWSSCSVSCGDGTRHRERFCELGTNRCRGPDYEIESCNNGECPSRWSDWTIWSMCSVTCGRGEKTRSRLCSGDYCPGDEIEKTSCEMPPCAYWTEWGPFGACSSTCGVGGIIERHRTCIGDGCPGSATERVPCPDMPPCPTWSEWTGWSQCSVTCGHGSITRQRSCIGLGCPGTGLEEKPCDAPPCPFWGEWTEWSPCTATCGEGIKHRQRSCQFGIDCLGSAKEEMFCFGPPCAAWSEWEPWSKCIGHISPDCGEGQATRYRSCLNPDGSRSRDCLGKGEDIKTCDAGPCCQWTEWLPWGDCTRSCGGGRRSRERKCERPGDPLRSGDCSCPGAAREENDCNMQACPPQCEWTEWCPWSTCSADPCHPDLVSRTRQCVGEIGCNCYGIAEETRQCTVEGPCTVS
ncbi:hypothetical protein AB6A40_001282 [Gnathostoma spinigerum]|uniref:Apple domain-containing protein n=1 Tax=Gnathostoma spinigerum TaxID=75299 RepID=A0ABD6E3S8_9BILA